MSEDDEKFTKEFDKELSKKSVVLSHLDIVRMVQDAMHFAFKIGMMYPEISEVNREITSNLMAFESATILEKYIDISNNKFKPSEDE